MTSRTRLHRFKSAVALGLASETATSEAADPAESYCASVADIEEFAGGLFADLGKNAPIEDQLDAEREILDYIRDRGYDRQNLPDGIADDWQLFWEGWTMRLEPGNPQPSRTPRQDDIRRAVRAVAWGEAIFGPGVADRVISFFAVRHSSAGSLPFPELTPREIEVLSLVADGLSNDAIARRLLLTNKTVRNHLANIFVKLQVTDRAEAIVRARRAGLGE